MGWITRDANGKAKWVSSSTILSSSEVIVPADLNSILGRFVVLLLVVDAREPDDFLDFGTTVISLWDMVFGSEDILFATSVVPNDLGYGILYSFLSISQPLVRLSYWSLVSL